MTHSGAGGRMSRRIPTRQVCALSAGETELPFGYYPVDTSRVWRGPKTGVGPISASPSRSHRQLRWPEPKGPHLALPARSPALRLPTASAVAFAPRAKTRAQAASSLTLTAILHRAFIPTFTDATPMAEAAKLPAFCLASLAITSQFCGSQLNAGSRPSRADALATTGRVGVKEVTIGLAGSRALVDGDPVGHF